MQRTKTTAFSIWNQHSEDKICNKFPYQKQLEMYGHRISNLIIFSCPALVSYIFINSDLRILYECVRRHYECLLSLFRSLVITATKIDHILMHIALNQYKIVWRGIDFIRPFSRCATTARALHITESKPCTVVLHLANFAKYGYLKHVFPKWSPGHLSEMLASSVSWVRPKESEFTPH